MSGGVHAATLGTFCADSSVERVGDRLYFVVSEPPAPLLGPALLGHRDEPGGRATCAEVLLLKQVVVDQRAAGALDRVAREVEPEAKGTSSHRRAPPAAETALLAVDELLDGCHDAGREDDANPHPGHPGPQPRRPASSRGARFIVAPFHGAEGSKSGGGTSRSRPGPAWLTNAAPSEAGSGGAPLSKRRTAST